MALRGIRQVPLWDMSGKAWGISSAEYLLGADPTDIDTCQNLLKQAGILGWRNFWIEPACWDIIGKSKGKPVYELLGGEARPIEVYCSTGEMHEPEKRVGELLAMKERGFRTAKLRVKNKELKDDIRHSRGREEKASATVWF